MGTAEFNAPKEKELRGLKQDAERVLQCQSCGRPLINLMVVSDGKGVANVTTGIRADCCYCGGFSQIESVVGEFFPGSATDEIVFDFADPKDDVVVITTARKK